VSTVYEHFVVIPETILTDNPGVLHVHVTSSLANCYFSVGNYLVKDQSHRAPDLAEKLSQLSMGPNRVSGFTSEKFTDLKARTNGSTIKRPLPVGARAWHGPADPFRRPYEIPGDRTFLPRKLVS
jgi:male germ cell-associated kinase